MRDRDIRFALRRQLHEAHRHEPDTLVIDELGLCQGLARVDIAVINGSINGYEIKSEKDTLARLPVQQEFYSKTFDTVTIVASGQHIEKIIRIIPDWWGIFQANSGCDGVQFEPIRKCDNNPCVDLLALAQFLWRDEAIEILRTCGFEKKVLSRPRRVLWQALADNFSKDDLSHFVRSYLKDRTNWRSAELPLLCDA